jgi:polyether ionophore transport system permease protein
MIARTAVAQARAIARRTLAESRIRDGAFALFFLLFAYANPVGYRRSYPTLHERLAFARSFGTNKAVELFYGVPQDLLTTGGFTAWRFGGFAAVITGIWGMLAAVRATRAEEDAGRQELVLAGAVSRRSAYLAALAGIGVAAAMLWLAIFAGLVAGRLPAGGSAYLALATMPPAVVFAGVGALASQLAPTRRIALELAAATLTLCFLLRVIADTASGLGGLRWATPFGWSEELRAFADPRPAVLLLPVASTALLLTAAGLIAVRRDVGTGILGARDRAEADLRLLSSPTAFALRSGLGNLLAWLVGVGVFAAIIGILSKSFTNADISTNLQEQLRKVGGASITTPAGALGFYFLIFVLAISLYVCGQIAAIRREEADQQLETLFALPVDRRRWLAGRLALVAAGAATIALGAGLLAWAGAASQHAHVPLSRLLEAGANCLQTALLFLGLGILAFAITPRAASGIAYGLVTLGFVWELFGALFGAPHWLLDATPFAHIGLVPAQPFRATAALAMLGIAGAAGLAGAWLFARRDLAGT